MAAEQGSERAERTLGEAAGAGGRRIPRGGGRSRGRPCDGCSARSRPAAAHARQGGALRPGAPSGRARAAAPDTDGDGHDARGSARARLQRRLGPGTPQLSGGAGAGAPPAFSAGGGEGRPTEAPTPGDEGPPSGGGGSVGRRGGRRTDGGGPPAPSAPHPAPPLRGGATQPAASRPDPGAPGSKLLRGRPGGARSEEVAAAARAPGRAPGLGRPRVCAQRGSAGRCLQMRSGCATCFRRPDSSLTAPQGARRAGPLPPRPPRERYFGGGCMAGSLAPAVGLLRLPTPAPPRASRTGSSRRPAAAPGLVAGGAPALRPAGPGGGGARSDQASGSASGLWAGRAGRGRVWAPGPGLQGEAWWGPGRWVAAAGLAPPFPPQVAGCTVTEGAPAEGFGGDGGWGGGGGADSGTEAVRWAAFCSELWDPLR